MDRAKQYQLLANAYGLIFVDCGDEIVITEDTIGAKQHVFTDFKEAVKGLMSMTKGRKRVYNLKATDEDWVQKILTTIEENNNE